MSEPFAPVLLVPRVLEPEFCDLLVRAYEETGGADSGVVRSDDAGRSASVLDHEHKARRDATIKDPELRRAYRERVQRYLLPEVLKAFQFRATRIERYIVACYEAGGHFGAHRDNTTSATAHRKFAVTINLNADFEGGELRFPEFGDRTYRAPAGTAVVFSCSLLHEVRPVTSGLRYCTLPFLYDEAGEALRRRGEDET
jgi:predicted 2-oxoglutarate/Fe(II)-dependent dioxygenase YbiX